MKHRLLTSLALAAGIACGGVSTASAAIVADVAFVVDQSGSMGDEFSWLANSISAINTSLIAGGVTARYGLAGYERFAGNEAGAPLNSKFVDFSSNINDRQRIARDFAAIGDAPDFAAALEACARFYLIEQPDHKRKLLLEMSAESTRNPVVARSFRSVDRVVQDAFHRALERQLAAGRIKPAQSLDSVVQLLMVLGDGMFQRRAADPDFDAERLLAAIMAMIRQMLGMDQIRTPKKEGRIARRVA